MSEKTCLLDRIIRLLRPVPMREKQELETRERQVSEKNRAAIEESRVTCEIVDKKLATAGS